MKSIQLSQKKQRKEEERKNPDGTNRKWRTKHRPKYNQIGNYIKC